MTLIRKAQKWILLLVIVFGVLIPFTLIMIASFSDFEEIAAKESFGASNVPSGHERKPLGDFTGPRDLEEMRYAIQELEAIRVSVRNELRVMGESRTQLSQELVSHKAALSIIKKELTEAKMELQNTREKLARANREDHANYVGPTHPHTNPAPVIVLPARTRLPNLEHVAVSIPTEEQYDKCTYSICFDYTKCPLTQPFYIYIYFPDIFILKYSKDFISSLVDKYPITSDPSKACIFVAIVGPLEERLSSEDIEERLQSLPYWGDDGSNHLLIDLSDWEQSSSVLDGVAVGRAIVAQSLLSQNRYFRTNYDILTPPLTVGLKNMDPVWRHLPSLLPPMRSVLLYFQGRYVEQGQDTSLSNNCVMASDLELLRDALKDSESVVIETECPIVSEDSAVGGEWANCGTESSLCPRATFALVLGSDKGVMGRATYSRLIDALRCGAVPVVFGIDVLPFDSVIDWHKAAILLPCGRFSHVHYIIRSFEHNTILEYRRQGRFLWETYFSSPGKILDSVIAIARYNSLHPPPPSPEYNGRQLLAIPGNPQRPPSAPFQQNFSTSHLKDQWNTPPGPFYIYSLTPFKPDSISGSQFMNTDISSLPPHIIEAGGITGPYFENYLLGNEPQEQFTVVMLTYQRNDVLIQAIERLRDLMYLNKVVVVWNNDEDPPRDMEWPHIRVPIEVVQPELNSLNNRFLPFSNIETEAVLSIDDDVHLRHDEIQFAFRVWREARERIVGFPGRFHAWDVRYNSWLYNSNYTCELSMVLTGAAFFHKYYSYLYTYWMPQEIRDVVDKYTNCEDIAMNFLVSHLTRKPPLKVTSRWTFRCPGCPETLSASDEHFSERHVCINRFTEVYGYMPLLYTQFRLDSVLFKTRLPTNLEKCYQFI